MDDAENCRRKKESAEALILGLGSEKKRWTQQSVVYKDNIKLLVFVFINLLFQKIV